LEDFLNFKNMTVHCLLTSIISIFFYLSKALK
jgi:hypothetical protein